MVIKRSKIYPGPSVWDPAGILAGEKRCATCAEEAVWDVLLTPEECKENEHKRWYCGPWRFFCSKCIAESGLKW